MVMPSLSSPIFSGRTSTVESLFTTYVNGPVGPNCTAVVGSVNADNAAFRSAVEDLARFDRRALSSLISRGRFSDLPRSLTGDPSAAPKIVHVL